MRIRVGTLNVWALPEPLAQHVPERMGAIGERLADLDLDVIAFQEVWTRDARRGLKRAARRAGLEHIWRSKNPMGADGGLLVASRLPIEASRFEPYALRGHPEEVVRNLEYASGKGFAQLRLETAAGPVTLVNTHLHARYSSVARHRHVPHRAAQIVQLAHASAGAAEAPLVAVGDFNFVEREPDYEVLTGLLGLSDVAAALDAREPTCLGANPYRRSRSDKRKDYVFTREGRDGGLRAVSLERVFDEPLAFAGQPGAYSDHCGLVAELERGAPAPRAAASPDPRAVSLTYRLLDEGRAIALERQQESRELAGLGVGFAAIAGTAALPSRMSRRRFVRAGLGGLAALALTPSVFSEVLVPDEIQAFEDAARSLRRIAPPDVAAGPPR